MDYAIEIFSGPSWEQCQVIGVQLLADKVTFDYYWSRLERNLPFHLTLGPGEAIKVQYLNITVDDTCEYYQVTTTKESGSYFDQYTAIKILIKDNSKIRVISFEEYTDPGRTDEFLQKLMKWKEERLDS